MRTLPLLALLFACTPEAGPDTGVEADADTDSDSDTDTDTDTDTGTDTATDTATDTDTDTGTDTATDTGEPAADEYVTVTVDGTPVMVTSVVGYTSRLGNTISFTATDVVNYFPAFTFVIAQSTVLAVETDYDCSVSSSITFWDATGTAYYANYNVQTSCTYRLTELGDAVGERVRGTFSATMYDATLTTTHTLSDGSFDVILDTAG